VQSIQPLDEPPFLNTYVGTVAGDCAIAIAVDSNIVKTAVRIKAYLPIH